MIFKVAPPDFKKEIDVVGCYVQHDDAFLLLHRHAHKTNGNKWGLPAGKQDAGESPVEAMARELREETGLITPEDSFEYFDSVLVRNEGHDIQYHMFSLIFSERPAIQLSASEHQAFQWMTPQEALAADLIHDQDECIRLFFGMGILVQ